MHNLSFNIKIKLSIFVALSLLYSGLRAQNIDTAFKYYNAGRFDRAAMEFEKILPYLQKIYGITDKAYYTWYLFYTADCFSKDHKYTRAEKYYLQSLDVSRTRFGEESSQYSIPLGNLASLYQKSGSYQKAEPLYLKALSVVRKAYGDEWRDGEKNILLKQIYY